MLYLQNQLAHMTETTRKWSILIINAIKSKQKQRYDDTTTSSQDLQSWKECKCTTNGPDKETKLLLCLARKNNMMTIFCASKLLGAHE